MQFDFSRRNPFAPDLVETFSHDDTQAKEIIHTLKQVAEIFPIATRHW